MEIGQQVRRIEDGAVGTITRVTEPTCFFPDGSAADGEIQATFPELRYPKVAYRYTSAARFIEAI